MKKRLAIAAVCAIFSAMAYVAGFHQFGVVHAGYHSEGTVPKSYGRLVAAIADQIGTGLVFEDKEGVIRFVSVTGMKEGQLARYDTTPTQGGIPRYFGHLVAAVATSHGTGLVFEDADGVIRFVDLKGVTESELKRE